MIHGTTSFFLVRRARRARTLGQNELASVDIELSGVSGPVATVTWVQTQDYSVNIDIVAEELN